MGNVEEPREMTASTYGAVEAGAGAARQHGSAYRNYMAAVIGAWAVLFAATVLIVGYASQSSIALEQQAHTQMLEFTFEPERNVFEEFDPEGSAPEPWKQEYDLAKEANYEMINIKDAAPDAAEAGAITEGEPDPYSTGKSTLEVPKEVYTQEAPYDMNVVELGEPSLGQPFQEYDHSQEYSEDSARQPWARSTCLWNGAKPSKRSPRLIPRANGLPSAILRTQALLSTEAMASAFAHCHIRCLPGASRSRHRGTVLSLK